MSINCPHCGQEGRVLETRKKDGIATRRRVCASCGERWTTWESGDNLSMAANIKIKTLDQVQEFLNSVRNGIRRTHDGA